MMLSAFCFNGKLSTDLSVILTQSPIETVPERDVEVVDIPGRNGDLIFDRGRYRNTLRTYECAFLSETPDTYDLRLRAVCAMLRPTAGYFRLEDTYNRNVFRMARSVGSLSVTSLARQAGTFTVEFDCKPQVFLKDGEIPVVFRTPEMIYNDTAHNALPLIRVFGSAAGEITLGGVTVAVHRLEDTLVLDCETCNAYSVDTGGNLISQNSEIYAPKFPALLPGENEVSWTGGIEHLEIIPRWWTL